jgi:hypothetical protein
MAWIEMGWGLGTAILDSFAVATNPDLHAWWWWVCLFGVPLGIYNCHRGIQRLVASGL